MNDHLYKHVLFKDLKEYLRREDYMGGYTPIEQSWIRKNLGIESLSSTLEEITHEKLLDLISHNKLIPGKLYLIDYLENYKMIVIADSPNDFFKSSIMIAENNSTLWDVKFDVLENKVIYLRDENGNEANFDFKHIKVHIFDEYVYVFSDENGNENSKNCKNNNLCQSNNVGFFGSSNNNLIKGSQVLFKVPVNNFNGELNDIKIESDEIGLSNETVKQTITFENKKYIDYLDLETLTHQFYEL